MISVIFEKWLQVFVYMTFMISVIFEKWLQVFVYM